VSIDGSFIAQGGEKYITLGNFCSNTLTDTIFVNEAISPYDDYPTSYFFVDDVSLKLDTSNPRVYLGLVFIPDELYH